MQHTVQERKPAHVNNQNSVQFFYVSILQHSKWILTCQSWLHILNSTVDTELIIILSRSTKASSSYHLVLVSVLLSAFQDRAANETAFFFKNEVLAFQKSRVRSDYYIYLDIYHFLLNCRGSLCFPIFCLNAMVLNWSSSESSLLCHSITGWVLNV